MKRLILIVDDEPNVRLSYRMALETEGYVTEEAQNGPKALELLAAHPFALALLDLQMPEMNGLELLAKMRARAWQTPVVMITAHGDVPHAVHAMKLGAIDFLQKPLTPPQLREVVREVLERHHATPPERAKEALDPALSAEERFDACLSNAKRFLNLQQFEAARPALAEAMALNPLSSDAFNLAGVLFESLGELHSAQKCYAQSTKLNARHEAAQQNLQRLVQSIQDGKSAELPAFPDI